MGVHPDGYLQQYESDFTLFMMMMNYFLCDISSFRRFFVRHVVN